MHVLKKLHRPTNDQTILTEVYDYVARLMQAILSLPGVMLGGVKVNLW